MVLVFFEQVRFKLSASVSMDLPGDTKPTYEGLCNSRSFDIGQRKTFFPLSEIITNNKYIKFSCFCTGEGTTYVHFKSFHWDSHKIISH